MIETSITEINIAKVQELIIQEMKKKQFSELPEEIPEQVHRNTPGNIYWNGKIIYGLSYYLSKMENRPYRNAAIQKFIKESQYRKLFFFLIGRAIKNKFKTVYSYLHRKAKGGQE